MMKRIYTLLFCSIISTQVFPETAYFQKRIKEVSQYDSLVVERLLDTEGGIKPIKRPVLKILKDNNVEIYRVAKLFDIDPRSIVASITSENSLNVSVTDKLQTQFAKWTGVTKLGSKSMSIGLGQIGTPAAMEAEKLVASIEKRPVRSESEVNRLIIEETGSIYYAGAIAKYCIEAYKKQGIDISKKPEIIATVYNLGQCDMRASKAKATGTAPKSNYFGLFVEKRIDEMTKATLVPPPTGFEMSWIPKPSGQPVPVVAKSTPVVASPKTQSLIVKPKQDVARSLQAVSSDKAISIKIDPEVEAEIKGTPTQVFQFEQAVDLKMSPDSCNKKTDTYGTDGDMDRLESLKTYPVMASLQKKSLFIPDVTSVGCDGEDWVLIRSIDGKKSGWIRSELMATATSKQKNCEQKVSNECITQLMEKTGDRLMVNSIVREPGGTLEIMFESLKGHSPDWQMGLNSCVDRSKLGDGSQPASNPTNVGGSTASLRTYYGLINLNYSSQNRQISINFDSMDNNFKTNQSTTVTTTSQSLQSNGMPGPTTTGTKTYTTISPDKAKKILDKFQKMNELFQKNFDNKKIQNPYLISSPLAWLLPTLQRINPDSSLAINDFEWINLQLDNAISKINDKPTLDDLEKFTIAINALDAQIYNCADCLISPFKNHQEFVNFTNQTLKECRDVVNQRKIKNWNLSATLSDKKPDQLNFDQHYGTVIFFKKLCSAFSETPSNDCEICSQGAPTAATYSYTVGPVSTMAPKIMSTDQIRNLYKDSKKEVIDKSIEDSLLMSNINNIFKSATQDISYQSVGQNCYKLKSTIETLKSLNEISCVKEIGVPDTKLLNGMINEKNNKVIYTPYESRSIYTVKIGELLCH